MNRLTLLRARRFDTPAITAAICAAAYMAFIVIHLRHHSYDLSHFVTAGDRFVDARVAPKSLSVLQDSSGYDGQFYYRLALDPWTHTRTDFGIMFDLPEFRQSRILYPLLVWMLSLGRAEWVPVMMLALNYAGICWIGWSGGALAQAYERHALWGLMFPANIGVLLALSRDLTEVLQIGVLLYCLLLIRRRGYRSAAFLLTIAVFIKETTLLAVGAMQLAVAIEGCPEGRKAYRPWRVLLIPILTYAVWEVLLLFHWGRFPLLIGNRIVGPPLAGLIPFVQSIVPPANSFQRTWILELMLISAFTLSVAISLRSSAAALHDKLSWLCYAAFALCWTRRIWVEDWAFARQLSEFHVFGTIILLASPSRLKAPILAGSCLLWLWVCREILRIF